MIVKTSNGYQVRSHDGKKALSADNLSKEQAEKRLAQVEMFKHMKKGLTHFIMIEKADHPNQKHDPKTGRYTKQGDSAAQEQNADKKLQEKFDKSSYGLGWFYNRDNDKMIELEQGAMGGNGDHDGWIALGDNAEKLGVDKKKAVAFQAAMYGFIVNTDDAFAKYGEKTWENINGKVQESKTELWVNPMDQKDKKFEKMFKERYGYSSDEAQQFQFPQLVRIRMWKDGFFSATTNGTLDNKMVKIATNHLADILPKLKDNAIRQVSISDESKNYTMTPSQALGVENLRDLISFSKAMTVDEINKEAAKAEPPKSDEQADAGNYKKGHVTIHGIDIAVENPRGSIREGVSKDGKKWENKMHHHYGYIKGSKGADKDHVDVFIGHNTDSDKVFIVNQLKTDTGTFDEHKVMMGFDSKEDAKEGYLKNYDDGWEGCGSIKEMSIPEFKDWLDSDKTTRVAKAMGFADDYNHFIDLEKADHPNQKHGKDGKYTKTTGGGDYTTAGQEARNMLTGLGFDTKKEMFKGHPYISVKTGTTKAGFKNVKISFGDQDSRQQAYDKRHDIAKHGYDMTFAYTKDKLIMATANTSENIKQATIGITHGGPFQFEQVKTHWAEEYDKPVVGETNVKDGVLSIHNVYVKHGERGQGKGSAFVRDAEQKAIEQGAHTSRVVASDKSTGFWEKQGYTKTGKESKELGAIEMTKDLKKSIFIDMEKSGRAGLVGKKTEVHRKGKSFMQTIYVNPNKDQQNEGNSRYEDMQRHMHSTLEGIKTSEAHLESVHGKLEEATINKIRDNARATLSQYVNYLASPCVDLMHSYINSTVSTLRKSAPEFEGVDANHMDAMVRDSVKKIIYQEVESNKKQFTDHGVRHIVKNTQMQSQIMDRLSESGQHITGRDRLLANFIMTNHDIGYTTPEVRQPGLAGIQASNSHKEYSAQITERQAPQWDEGKIFSRGEYDRALNIIKTHDSTSLDAGDGVALATRLSDNLSLFQTEKLPSMFKYVKGSLYHLEKMGEAAKTKDEKVFEEHRGHLNDLIDKTQLNDNLKRDLKAGVSDVNFVTPKYALGTLAGEVYHVGRSNNSMVEVRVKYNEVDSFLQKMFEMGQRQTKKLLEDYGETDFTKKEYKLGNYKGKTVLTLKIT